MDMGVLGWIVAGLVAAGLALAAVVPIARRRPPAADRDALVSEMTRRAEQAPRDVEALADGHELAKLPRKVPGAS